MKKVAKKLENTFCDNKSRVVPVFTAVFDFFRGKKKNGFFVEAGAFDGEYISNSLYFELKHQVRHTHIVIVFTILPFSLLYCIKIIIIFKIL
jgi:hypothetical protein